MGYSEEQLQHKRDMLVTLFLGKDRESMNQEMNLTPETLMAFDMIEGDADLLIENAILVYQMCQEKYGGAEGGAEYPSFQMAIDFQKTVMALVGDDLNIYMNAILGKLLKMAAFPRDEFKEIVEGL